MPKFLMVQDHSFSYVAPKKDFWSLSLMSVIAAALLLVGHAAWADDQQGSGGRGHKGKREPAVRLLGTIPVPVSAANTTAGLYSFDISFVDQATQTYYLADRSNAVVDVVDAKTGTFDRQIAGGFRGVAVVNGVVQAASPVPTVSWPRSPGSS